LTNERKNQVIQVVKSNSCLITDIAWKTIILPESHPLLTPFIYTIPLQLLAYHVALAKGNDVDQPRNLAKSVTVE
jgi:glucosamine--fructose-6-phosphate aminotransferase (isomerizing)